MGAVSVVRPDGTRCSARFSPDRVYRYDLVRDWDTRQQVVAFIGLNPSTADESEDDPTIRRCIRYARDWGYGGIVMLNAFAFRATDPRDDEGAPGADRPEQR